MEIVCLDLEGVLVPEIWINFAKKTGIKELEATTRDIPDYDVLMTQRLNILKQHGLGLPDIQAVIADDVGHVFHHVIVLCPFLVQDFKHVALGFGVDDMDLALMGL